MNRAEWTKAVKHALIDKDKKMTELANDIEWSYSHVANILSQKHKTESHRLIKAISEYCGIEPYEEAEHDCTDTTCTCDDSKCGECRCR